MTYIVLALRELDKPGVEKYFRERTFLIIKVKNIIKAVLNV